VSRVIVGIQPVREAIRALDRRPEKVIVLERERNPSPTLDALVRFARDQQVAVEFAPAATLDRLAAGARHQGVVAIAAELDLLDTHQLLALAPTLVMALDRIEDPQNFGAIVRSAVAFGADAILWPEHSSAPLSAAMTRASAGAVEHAHLCRVPALPSALHALQSSGLQVVGLAGDSPTLLSDVQLVAPVVLVVGSEGSGIRKSVRASCDVLARLPSRPPISTLNASASAAIALYEVRRQREAARPPPDAAR
jgi:23S rRNA (guanosine2251-2'-O)-methyltransferase